ncbi:MAG: NAD(P)-dependent oxidoreductase [Nitrososphaerales archaeon]
MLINLNLSGKTISIIGGGKVGKREALKLLGEGSKITVMSKDFTKALKRLKDENESKFIKSI